MSGRSPEDQAPDAAEVVRFATVASVDLAAARCTVRAGGIESGPIRWIEGRAGATRTWSPPSVGEQVLLLCPEGELAAGVVLRGTVSDANPAAGDSAAELIQFGDGTVIRYDPEAHTLEATLCAGGSALIVADAGVTIEGPVTISGDVDITGTVTVSDDVVAGDISLVEHLHGGVEAGSADTDVPK